MLLVVLSGQLICFDGELKLVSLDLCPMDVLPGLTLIGHVKATSHRPGVDNDVETRKPFGKTGGAIISILVFLVDLDVVVQSTQKQPGLDKLAPGGPTLWPRAVHIALHMMPRTRKNVNI